MGWLLASLILPALFLFCLYLYARGIAGFNGDDAWRTFLDLLKRLNPWAED